MYGDNMKNKFSFMWNDFVANVKNFFKLRKLGKLKDAKLAKKLLKEILNSTNDAFAVSGKLEEYGFRADEDRPLDSRRHIILAVVQKKFDNGGVELSMFENDPNYPDKRVVVLLYFNFSKKKLEVLEFGGIYTDKVVSVSKSEEKVDDLVVIKEKKPNPTRMSK